MVFGYLTAIPQLGLSGQFDDAGRNQIEKWWPSKSELGAQFDPDSLLTISCPTVHRFR